MIFQPSGAMRSAYCTLRGLAYFPRLLNAQPEQLSRYVISGGGSGLHSNELDEDISVENLLMGIGDRTHVNKAAA